MNLSIIIVNWNCSRYIRECVLSIREYTKRLSLEIIVVDNASPNEDPAQLAEQFPEIRLIRSGTNLGFAGANNLGFRYSSGNLILFLNPDTRLINSAAELMCAAMSNLPYAGILGCRLLNTDLSLQTSCVQKFPTILNQLLDSDWLRNHWPKSNLWGIQALFSKSVEPAHVEVISGACMMVRRDVFERIGLFTEDYFMYAEDLDLCYKATQAGYSNYYLDTAQIVHHGGGSSSGPQAIEMKWNAVSKFCDKHYGKYYASFFRLIMAAAAGARLGIIGAAGLFMPKKSRDRALTKWRTILGTLANYSHAPGSLSAD